MSINKYVYKFKTLQCSYILYRRRYIIIDLVLCLQFSFHLSIPNRRNLFKQFDINGSKSFSNKFPMVYLMAKSKIYHLPLNLNKQKQKFHINVQLYVCWSYILYMDSVCDKNASTQTNMKL